MSEAYDQSQTVGEEGQEEDANASLLKEMHAKLDKLGLILSQSRSEAIDGRQVSGIEDEWIEDEEYYEGVDDANRHEVRSGTTKPLGQAAPDIDDDEETGSTIFVNITRPYCDATSARMGDMLLPTDDKGWSIKPTPKPEFIDIAKGKLTYSIQQAISAENVNDPDGEKRDTDDVMGQLQEELKVANEAAKMAENQIWDWHVECQFHAENRRIIEDASKVGTGVLKGPIPIEKSKRVFKDGQLQVVKTIQPVSRRINYKNLFPDPSCGESIHDGNYIWERDDITMKKLYQLRGDDNYIQEQIDKCVEEGPQEASKDFREEQERPGLMASTETRIKMFEIWYYHGMIKKSDMVCCDIISGEAFNEGYEPPKEEYVFAEMTMVNNRVIKCALSHLETGAFPYDLMVWQRRVGMPWGIGVARQIRPAQRIIVGAIRHMMDNAGIAGGPMFFYNDMIIAPANDVSEVRPWKVWVAGPDYEAGMDLKEAIQFLEAPMMQNELESIVNIGLKLAEDITGLPLIMQGQTNQRTPTTLGGMQMQNNNSSTVLRRVARNHDDMITEPHISRYYDHILEYGEDDRMKGEFTIDAMGSSALIERDMQNESTLALGQYVLNPVFGIDPKKWMGELLKSNKLELGRFEYDDEEWQEVVQRMTQPPPDPRLEIAQMMAESRERSDQFKLQGLVSENEKDRELKIVLEEMSKEFDVFQTEMKNETSMSNTGKQAQMSMAETMAKLKAQLALSSGSEKAGEVSQPLIEPPQRAPAGESYTQ